MLALARALKGGREWKQRGLCYIWKDKNENYIELPSYEECVADKLKFIDAFNRFLCKL